MGALLFLMLWMSVGFCINHKTDWAMPGRNDQKVRNFFLALNMFIWPLWLIWYLAVEFY
ncbi:hypothetical protein [Klebsiella phage PhiKpNIH-6]|uniref:Uncharacterized protein n=1 Tax=Klebsiella phage PhiKpNIH-6 TaxID=2689112 RepID=A0A6B9M3K4_9CAUD|nr:hypothetical protein [Klebsiella phage PhiKpNIH-6]